MHNNHNYVPIGIQEKADVHWSTRYIYILHGKFVMVLSGSGPNENSLEDFWRMMWEERVPTIVMLTRIFEGRVCRS